MGFKIGFGHSPEIFAPSFAFGDLLRIDCIFLSLGR